MFFILHILLMATATMGIIAGISAAMFFRKKKNWLKIHKTVNASGVAGATVGIIMAVVYISGSGGEHIEGIHPVAGLIAFISAWAALLAGFYQFKAKNKLAVRSLHRWLGRFLLLMLMTAITLGIILINIF